MSITSGLIPSSFLPHLSRTQNTLEPLSPSELLAHISILRELYLPPIHGGFHADDVFDDDDDDERESRKSRARARSKRKGTKGKQGASSSPEVKLSAGMNGLGLGFGMVNDPSSSTSTSTSGTATPSGQPDDSELSESEDSDTDSEAETAHLDSFEREWAEKWLGGVVRRSQGWLEVALELEPEDVNADEVKEVEAVLRDATAVQAMMAGTSAAGSLTRHLVFPIAHSLAPGLSLLRSNAEPNPALSPETNSFLAALSSSPTSPRSRKLRRPSVPSGPTDSVSARRHSESGRSDSSTSPSVTNTSTLSPSRRVHRKKKQPVVPVLLHDAPMGDHLGVGMQTWGSAILLGRRMALRPEDFGLFLPPHLSRERGVRVLELGAGTGLLSILCRKLLDLHHASASQDGSSHPGLIVATDFLSNVLDNLKICVDLNFPPHLADSGKVDSSTDIARDQGIHIAKLDWTTFPGFMRSQGQEGEEELAPFVSLSDEQRRAEQRGKAEKTFDLVLASDCVYDETHAKLLRDVAGWVLRLPDPDDEGGQGGTFHILSPLRPTFAPELESIDTHFPPLSTYAPLAQRQHQAASSDHASDSAPSIDMRGEGLGIARGLKLGVRGEGKRGVRGRKGEGRVDENQGYWWWEVGWG